MQSKRHRSSTFFGLGFALADEEHPATREWADAGNTIGMLALRMGLLSVEQIDHILESQEQEGSGRRFGELAESLGLLSHDQVARLLAIQSLNRELELGERLVLAGRIHRPRIGPPALRLRRERPGPVGKAAGSDALGVIATAAPPQPRAGRLSRSRGFSEGFSVLDLIEAPIDLRERADPIGPQKRASLSLSASACARG